MSSLHKNKKTGKYPIHFGHYLTNEMEPFSCLNLLCSPTHPPPLQLLCPLSLTKVSKATGTTEAPPVPLKKSSRRLHSLYFVLSCTGFLLQLHPLKGKPCYSTKFILTSFLPNYFTKIFFPRSLRRPNSLFQL